MAFKKTLAQRLSNVYKTTGFSISASRISSSSMSPRKLVPPHPDDKIAPDPGNGIIRRFIHRRLIGTSPATSPDLRSLPTGESLIEKIREMDVNKSRIKLDGFLPPLEMRSEPEPEVTTKGNLTVEDAKKLFKVSQLEMVKLRLRQTEKNCVSYPEFVQICSGISSNNDSGIELAKILDDSGTVLVLGNVVFLRPDQVVKTLQSLLPIPATTIPKDPQMMEEFNKMEEEKTAIDRKAESLVRRELWAGLGYFVIQTAAFMRLTFWELSWDVMEPICFYVTSFYCMAGYTFFLRTAKEPSFEGFYQSRFVAKQKRLMKVRILILKGITS